MPSASHASPALEDTLETDMRVQAERPVMTRKASGAMRELSGEHKQAVKDKNSLGPLKRQDQVDQSPKTRFEAPTEEENDPVAEAQVDAMVKKGKIEVGVAPDMQHIADPTPEVEALQDASEYNLACEKKDADHGQEESKKGDEKPVTALDVVTLKSLMEGAPVKEVSTSCRSIEPEF